jgi:hypothetical protein
MLRRQFVLGIALLVAWGSMGLAESIRPGKYTGVVVFDRWGGCELYRGVGVMYVSERVKQQLKDQAGKCVEVDATEVRQPLNPGGASIEKLTILGPARDAETWCSAEGLKLVAAPAFKDGQPPELALRVENTTEKPVTVHMNLLGPTVLGKKVGGNPLLAAFEASDGPSHAVVTDQSLWTEPGGEPRSKIKGVALGRKWQWTITEPRTFEKHVKLGPKGTLEVHILLELPEGEYEFLAGYGGNFSQGRSIASNRVGFDVGADGTASVAK